MSLQIKQINTALAPKAIGPYSQGVNAGNFLFISGQLPIDPQTSELAAPSIRIQTNRVLDNLEAVLSEAGSSLAQVVRCDVFLKDMGDFGAFNEEYAKRFNGKVPPARQTIQAARLPLDALIEISCIALLNK
jgi:2-iminobutanoate/2-iminopropanoate deaminase